MTISFVWLFSFLLIQILKEDDAAAGSCPEGVTCFNGLCNEAGECECWDGWSGERCDIDVEDVTVKSRRKRSLPAVATVTEIEFYLNKEASFENVTDIYPGSRIHFSLTIHLPPGIDLLVELFTPDNSTTVMAICDVEITWCGSNIIQCPDVLPDGPVLSSKDPGDLRNDQAILNFGILNNTEADTSSYEPNSIVIEWDAVMVPNPLTVDGAEYWVSAGAEYASQTMIWVGQTSVVAHTSEKPGLPNPTFVISGSDTIDIGSSEIYTIDAHLTFGAGALTFDALSPITGSGEAYVAAAKISSVGRDFDCLNNLTGDAVTPELFDATDYDGYDRIRLSMGTVVNKGAHDTYNELPDDNKLQLQFVVCATDEIAAQNEIREIGAALEIGDTHIWAATFNVSLIARVDSNAALPTPPVVTLTATPSSLPLGSPVFIDLEVEIPEETNTEYMVEFSMPYVGGQARLTICSVVVTFLGENMPCKKSTVEPTFSSQAGNDKYDYALVNLGRIRNTGFFNSSFYPEANKFRIRAVASLTNHPDNVAGLAADVSAVFRYGPDSTTKTMTLNLNSSADPYPMSSAEYPDWEMNFTMGDGNVPVGGMTVAEITLRTKPLVYYTNLETEVLIPIVDNDYLYQVCSYEVVHVGSNIACFDLAEAVSTTTPYSNFSDGIFDRITMTLGSAMNKRLPTGVLLDPDDDVIRLRTVVRVRDHPANVDGYQNWLSAGFKFHPLKLWVGQLQITAVAVPTPIDPANLYVSVNRADDVTGTDLYVGKSLRYVVIMKMESMTQGPAVLTVSTGAATGIKVCALYLVYVGEDIGCSYNTDINATYTLQSGSVDNYATAELDLGMIANVANVNMTANDTVDNSTVVVEFVVQLTPTAAPGNTFTVDVRIDSGSSTDIVANLDQTVTAVADVPGTNTPMASLPTYQFIPAPIANESVTDVIVPGESKKFYFDIYFAEHSNNAYNIKFLSPVNFTGALEICGAAVVSVGRNLPCLSRNLYKDITAYDERISSDYDDIGTLDLGYVCQVPLYNDTEENKIRLEVVARAPRHAGLLEGRPLEGELIWISATAKINADQIYVTQRSLTVSYDNSTFKEITNGLFQPKLVLDDTSPMFMRPASIGTVRVNVSVPPNTEVIGKLEVLTELSRSAVLTVNKVSVVLNSGGDNLGCFTAFPEMDFFPDYISNVQTSQITNTTLNLGIITNSGITLIDERYVPTDDVFAIDVELQMADSAVNVLNYTTDLTIKLRVANTALEVRREIVVFRDNLESPQLVLSANVTNDTEIYNEGLQILVEAELQHGDMSSAEAYNVSVVFYYPKYLSFLSIDQVNMTETRNYPQPHLLPNDRGVVFFFDHVYFTDIIYWTFVLEVVPVPMSEPADVYDASTPYEAYSNMIYRDSNVESEGYFYATPLDYLAYMVQPTVAPGANVIELGMGNGNIKDCQLEASVGSDPAVNARPTNAGWKAANRGPIYQPYFQVNFGNIARVTEIVLTAPTGFSPDVAVDSLKYDVFTSNDYFVWTHIELMTGSGVLTAPAIGRHFRIAINKQGVAPDADVGFKVELKGYYVSDDVLPVDVCRTPDTWQVVSPPTEMYYRGFVAHGTSMFFCDLVAPGRQNIYEEEVECYKTTDGTTWQVLDKSVFNVIGYDAATNHLFGLCKDKKSYLISDDMGNTWYATSKTYFDAATKVTPKTVPYTKTATFQESLTEPDPSFRDETGIAGAHFKGMYYFSGTGNQVTDWSTCCLA